MSKDSGKNYAYSDEQLQYNNKSVSVTQDEAKEICSSTIGQRQTVRWHDERSTRIPASNFERVINRRKSIHPSSIIKTITEKKILQRNPPSQHLYSGAYTLKTLLYSSMLNIQETKIAYKSNHVDLSSILNGHCLHGCTPDGIVVDSGIVSGGCGSKMPLL